MKRIIITGFLLIALFSGSVANAADFDKGFEAFNKKDYKTALRELKPLAEQGHVKAQFFLGLTYANSGGGRQKNIRSYMWLKLAALAGNETAKEVLELQADRLSEGAIAIVKKRAKRCFKNKNYKNCFEAGIANAADFQKGFEAFNKKDYKTALRELKPLAEKGDAGAQTNLGLMYDNGDGVPQDYKQAAQWYRLAAEQNYAVAQYNLGVMYAGGEGVLQDDKQAVKWYRPAAEQGLAPAQYNLGVMYDKGQGVTKDDKQAVQWYRQAAIQGMVEAQNNLGVMYGLGDGVPKDYIRAYMWFNIAASAGQEGAKGVRNLLAKKMSADDIVTAKKRAKKCIKSNYKKC